MNAGNQGSERKISEVFLEFSEPLWVRADRSATREELERALRVAWLAWNAMVADTLNADGAAVSRLREQMQDVPELTTVFDLMLRRKKSVFPHDLRLVKRYTVVDQDGQWRLRVEAAAV
jgi:hypothetical protein